jgi:hypothetical protein
MKPVLYTNTLMLTFRNWKKIMQSVLYVYYVSLPKIFAHFQFATFAFQIICILPKTLKILKLENACLVFRIRKYLLQRICTIQLFDNDST